MSLKQFDIQQKILCHYDRISPWLQGEVIYPINIEIDPTNACNENCKWCCWEEHRKDKTTMSRELLNKIVHNLARVGVKSINWTGGGEPLINKYVPEFMKISKDLGMENGIFTNGILLTSKKLPILVENCTWIRISLGAATPETFLKCHGTNDFYKIIENIKELVRVKKELKSDVTIGISMLVDVDNYHELYEAAVMAKELGVDYFQGKPLIQMGSEDLDWWMNEVIPKFKKSKELETPDFQILVAQYTQSKYGKAGTNFMGDEKELEVEKDKNVCHVHNFVTAITANGDVSFCKNLRDNPEFILGNLKDQMMEEIYNSERRKDIEKKINEGGCGVFCQNAQLNETLKFLKTPNEKNHLNFL
jgi:MoaA/NifB/PqqE/SkfB family radical SAM enzyme